MQFMDAVKIAFTKYVNFRGVASRPEYWWFFLFGFIVTVIAFSFDMAIRQTDSAPFQSLISLALFLPQLTIMVRRNRDAGFSAWWLTLWTLPIALFILGISNNVQAFSDYALINDFEALSEEQLLQSLLPLIGAVLPGILTLLAVSIFFFVVSLLPTKKSKVSTPVAPITY
jgi:uncharacterized membrane protein YhaH (DUF805 family)